MTDSPDSWFNWLAVASAYAMVLTLLVSPVLLFWYRRRVAHWMRQDAPNAAPPPPLADAAQVAIRWVRMASTGAYGASKAAVGGKHVLPDFRRLVAGHACGGIACALLLTACLCVLYAHLFSASMLVTTLVVFLLPVWATVLLLLSASSRLRLLGFVGAALLLLLLLGVRQGLAATLFGTFVLVPLLLLLVFCLRFWRGVAPLVFVVALASSLLAVATVEYLVKGLGLATAWPWRVAGFAIGAWLGYQALRALQAAYDAGRFSDLELFIDAWWLAYLLVQTTVLLIMGRHPGYLLALLGFALLVGVRRAVWRAWPPERAAPAPRSLLLLRVFGDERRMQSLFDRLEQHWRHVGPMLMIAGWDLALRNIGPADFVAFLGGRLRRQFVRNAADLASRLATLPMLPDADGRYRVSHFWCHADTWRPTMRALAARSQAVLMDLRGFTHEREGCRYELLHLARHAPNLPVLLLVDGAKAYGELQGLLGGTEVAAAPWVVADIAADAVALDGHLLTLLAGRGARLA